MNMALWVGEATARPAVSVCRFDESLFSTANGQEEFFLGEPRTRRTGALYRSQ